MGRPGIVELVKRPGRRDAARCEAAGLDWLREASPRVVRVLAVDDEELHIERISVVRPTAEAARVAGRELARIHDAGARAFGAPPPGWSGLNYIGTQVQDCQPRARWSDFYVEQRVLPFARRARAAGNLSGPGLAEVERACACILASPIFDAERPARIHGDLWAGNLLFGDDGPVFIDPAAHGGHRETDLAMLSLFGAPFLRELIAGYESAHPLASGWRDLVCVHQLHPLAVHALTHGPAYAEELVAQARASRSALG